MSVNADEKNVPFFQEIFLKLGLVRNWLCFAGEHLNILWDVLWSSSQIMSITVGQHFRSENAQNAKLQNEIID